ncbi:hypothetical protein SELMODRAFT_402718 [Selaginella moellendorffii]|uniref:Uncharacterized protein n=1 Tax=Selaginella moellendorffii TaxID=88036 RepID=D8QMU2_SELML|nr:hypothetical protein SELMODRAFT_402718 [Selaginella moellendorffii]
MVELLEARGHLDDRELRTLPELESQEDDAKEEPGREDGSPKDRGTVEQPGVIIQVVASTDLPGDASGGFGATLAAFAQSGRIDRAWALLLEMPVQDLKSATAVLAALV